MSEDQSWLNGESVWPKGYVLCERYVIDNVVARRPLLVSYQAFDLVRSRPVVLETLDGTLTHDPVLMPRLREEAHRAQELTHENMTVFYGIETDGPHLFCVRDYVDGPALSDYLSQSGRPLAFYEALQVIVQTGSALHYAHRAGILHRAINPRSILLRYDGRVIVLGFALPSLVGISSETDLDPHYLSPEQCAGQKIDHRSDIYSLAAVAYRLYAGCPPFTVETIQARDGESWEKLCSQHVHAAVPFASTLNQDLPKDVSWVLSKALAKRSEERFRSAAEFVAVMKRAWHEAGLDPEAMCAEPPSWIREPVPIAPPKQVRARRAAQPVAYRTAPEPAVVLPKRKAPMFWLGGLFLVVLAVWGVLLAFLFDDDMQEQASLVLGQRPVGALSDVSEPYDMPTWTPPIIPTPTGTRISTDLNAMEFVAPTMAAPSGIPFNGLRALSNEFDWTAYIGGLKWRSYTDPSFGYALVYPEGWRPEPAGNVLRLYMPDRDAGVIVCSCGTRVADANQWVTRVLEILKGDFPGLEQLDQRIYKPGWLATLIRAPQDENDEIQMAVLSFGHEQRGYAVVFVAWASDWQGVKPIFDQMAQNMRFP